MVVRCHIWPGGMRWIDGTRSDGKTDNLRMNKRDGERVGERGGGVER